jgi:hypothetical protein
LQSFAVLLADDLTEPFLFSFQQGNAQTAREELQQLELKLNRSRQEASNKLDKTKNDLAQVSNDLLQKGNECMRAISSMSAMSQHGAAIIDAQDRVINSQKRQQSIQVMNLHNNLKASRTKTSRLVTKLWKLKNRDKQKADRSNWPLAKQTMAVRALVNGYQQDAVAALEAYDGLKNTVLQLQEANAFIMARLKLTEGKLQSALAICAKPENNPTKSTNWGNVEHVMMCS